MLKWFSRGACGQNTLWQTLALAVNERTDDKLLNIESEPMHIYKPWVSQMESKMGEARYGSCYCDVSYKSCTAVLHCSVDRSKAPLASLRAIHTMFFHHFRCWLKYVYTCVYINVYTYTY